VSGLWLIGAGIWPGPGLNAVSGYEVARALSRRPARGRELARRATRGPAAIADQSPPAPGCQVGGG
ncbi:MAG: hypothetical protein ACRDZ6_03670, partial [Acidimicrobiales bacterium]